MARGARIHRGRGVLVSTRSTAAILLFLTGTGACARAPADIVDTTETAGATTTSPVTTNAVSDGLESTSGNAEGGAASSGEEEREIIYDVNLIPDVPGTGNCGAPNPVTCDHQDDDPWHAIGLNCTGGPHVQGEYNGDERSLYVHEGPVGTYEPAPFPPREGEKILILSSGISSDLLIPNYFATADVNGYVDNGSSTLPEPLVPMNVSDTKSCAEDPGLIGDGDCSNTIEEQWTQGNGANDYAELRITTKVPLNTTGFSYDFAFLSTEYPDYYQSQFNDMYIAWLESEQWTGNVSFDESGNPISLNAGFLDYKDAPNPVDCPPPCQAPELQGTAMVGHAATKWLTTSASVSPQEDITLVFAVFDLSDGALDTFILLDNWLWNCGGGPPVTVPG